jgi:hypothetical protein
VACVYYRVLLEVYQIAYVESLLKRFVLLPKFVKILLHRVEIVYSGVQIISTVTARVEPRH